MGLGENIREAREKAAISQKALAEILGVQQSTLSGYENQNHMPSEDTIIKISDTLDVSTDYLFGLTQTPMSVVRLDDEYCCGITMGETLEMLTGIEDTATRSYVIQLISLINRNQPSFVEINKELKNVKKKKK